MNFLVKTTTLLLCLTLLLTNDVNAQAFLDLADYTTKCPPETVHMVPTDNYYGNPGVIVYANDPEGGRVIANVSSSHLGFTTNNNSLVDYYPGQVLAYYTEVADMPHENDPDKVTCYVYFENGSSCRIGCTVVVDGYQVSVTP